MALSISSHKYRAWYYSYWQKEQYIILDLLLVNCSDKYLHAEWMVLFIECCILLIGGLLKAITLYKIAVQPHETK